MDSYWDQRNNTAFSITRQTYSRLPADILTLNTAQSMGRLFWTTLKDGDRKAMINDNFADSCWAQTTSKDTKQRLHSCRQGERERCCSEPGFSFTFVLLRSLVAMTRDSQQFTVALLPSCCYTWAKKNLVKLDIFFDTNATFCPFQTLECFILAYGKLPSNALA